MLMWIHAFKQSLQKLIFKAEELFQNLYLTLQIHIKKKIWIN